MADPLPQGGQNCLRGSGPRIYSSKVLEGNWVNDQKLVTFEGNRPEVVTELQVRGAQVTGRFVPVYGASLRSTYAHIRSVENDLDYENPVYPYRKYTADKWVSVNQTTHFGMSHKCVDGEASMFESGFRAPRHELIRDPAKMAAYRARWINETEPALREQRFTSSVAAGSAGSTAPGFAPSVQRFLVGVPKSVEVLRQKCVDALGSDGVLRLHVLLPPRFKRSAASMVNPLQIALRDICGVKLNIDMANELWKMLDPLEKDVAERRDLMHALLCRPLDGARLEAVHRAWAVLLELGRGSASLATARACFDGAAHVDVRGKPPFIVDVLGRADPARAVEVIVEGLAIVAAERRRPAGWEQPGAHALPPGSLGSLLEVRARNLEVFAAARAGFADEAAPLEYEDFEDLCSYLHVGMTSDLDFCRMLGVGFRIGAPVISGPGAQLGGGGAAAGGAAVHLAASGASVPALGGSPARSLALPARKARGEGLRTTSSDFGSGLAFATVPYRPGEGARAVSPNRRQSTAVAGTGDAEAAAASALANVCVLVTHENGRKALHRFPRDRFYDATDEQGIRDRLAKVGVRGVAAVSVEF